MSGACEARSGPAFGADFFARARARLRAEPPRRPVAGPLRDERGDHAFSPSLADEMPPEHKDAAVLIPVIDRDEVPTVLFTRRSTALRNHSGQIAFPGGRVDPGDDGPLGAALRESEEEIGLARRFVTPLGYLDSYLTTTGFRIVPVVARVAPGFALTINPAEVDDTFECPLPFLMDPRNHRRESREWRGLMRSYYAMPFGDHYIWGVTAGIVRNLYEQIWA